MALPAARSVRRAPLWIGLAVIASLLIVVALTLVLTPQGLNPAFAAALDFANAAGKGDDPAAFALLDPAMQRFVLANCPDGRVSACIADYIPPEWGGFLSVVFRRAAPDGPAWDVELIATYAEDKGFSGVCIFQRMEPDTDTDGAWRVAGWAGYISCGDGRSRNIATNPDTPHRAP